MYLFLKSLGVNPVTLLKLSVKVGKLEYPTFSAISLKLKLELLKSRLLASDILSLFK